MHRGYWESLSATYAQEVFDVRRQDRSGIIASRLDGLANPNHDAADLGCGVGRWLPLLAGRFRHVTGVDISRGLLNQARRTCGHLSNVAFHRLDLARTAARLPRAHLVLCVNAILTPVPGRRLALFRAVVRQLRPGGHLLLVVPALESALLAHHRLTEWNLKDGQAPGRAQRTPLARDCRAGGNLAHGVLRVDGVPTKHYLREELEVLLAFHRLEALEILKIEYPWSTEFARPPRWMRAPHPWDWFVVGRRRS